MKPDESLHRILFLLVVITLLAACDFNSEEEDSNQNKVFTVAIINNAPVLFRWSRGLRTT